MPASTNVDDCNRGMASAVRISEHKTHRTQTHSWTVIPSCSQPLYHCDDEAAFTNGNYSPTSRQAVTSSLQILKEPKLMSVSVMKLTHQPLEMPLHYHLWHATQY
jgi:hypothetical protein